MYRNWGFSSYNTRSPDVDRKYVCELVHSIKVLKQAFTRRRRCMGVRQVHYRYIQEVNAYCMLALFCTRLSSLTSRVGC